MKCAALIASALMALPIVASATETITYSYDDRGRLVKVAHAGTINDGLVSTYSFDKADNRLSTTVSGGGSPATPTPTNAAKCVAVVPMAGSYRVIVCAPPV